LKEKPDLEVIRLDLHSFGSEDRLYRALVRASSIPPLGQWGHELHVYLDSFDECLLRIDTVAALLADELPRYPLRRVNLRIACRKILPCENRDTLQTPYYLCEVLGAANICLSIFRCHQLLALIRALRNRFSNYQPDDIV